MVIVDSTMVATVPHREDITLFEVPATQLAEDNGLKGLANVVLVGKLLGEIGFCGIDALDAAIVKSVPPKRQQLLEPNRRALALGMDGTTCEM
jgi:2-oxoglutarate ferredoxin oxidoreductase subunit gamma